jgi:hypothetical protein
VIKKEAEKFLKYKDHTIETQRMWNVKTKVIQVTIGASGTYTRSLRKYLKKYNGKPRNHGSAKQPCWALRTYFGSINFKVQNIQHGK